MLIISKRVYPSYDSYHFISIGGGAGGATAPLKCYKGGLSPPNSIETLAQKDRDTLIEQSNSNKAASI